MVFHQGFRVTGAVNKTMFDEGIESTEKEPKTILSVLIQVSAYADNDVEGWIEKSLIFNIPDKLIDTTAHTGSTYMQHSANRINEIPVGVELPIGERFRVAIKCGATATNIVGAYVYEVRE